VKPKAPSRARVRNEKREVFIWVGGGRLQVEGKRLEVRGERLEVEGARGGRGQVAGLGVTPDQPHSYGLAAAPAPECEAQQRQASEKGVGRGLGNGSDNQIVKSSETIYITVTIKSINLQKESFISDGG
jgi:hypothetical protein